MNRNRFNYLVTALGSVAGFVGAVTIAETGFPGLAAVSLFFGLLNAGLVIALWRTTREGEQILREVRESTERHIRQALERAERAEAAVGIKSRVY